MSNTIVHEVLDNLYKKTAPIRLDDYDRIIIFSDLHVGDGSSKDDFLRNSDLFLQVLKQYYLKRGFSLILNGDIEELQRFTLKSIEQRWSELYELITDFQNQTRLFKLVGNHDYELSLSKPTRTPFRLYESMRLSYDEEQIFVIHGHQASLYLGRLHQLNTYLLRYIANPLRIKNPSVAYDSRKQYKTEQRIYDFSSEKKMITIIGHTHRPMFESNSKIDDLRFRIEQKLRDYSISDDETRVLIQKEVAAYKDALSNLYDSAGTNSIHSGLYNRLVVPSLFNSGCVIGKRGITGIEIENGDIRLVHWFDRTINHRHLDDADVIELENSDYCRTIIKRESLNYVFARIALLG